MNIISRIGRHLRLTLTYLALAVIWLFGLMLTSFLLALVLTAMTGSTHFLTICVIVFFVTVLIALVICSTVPVLLSAKNRAAQDIVFLIVGLAVLLGILDVQRIALTRLRTQLSEYEETASGYIRNLRDLGAREECNVPSRPPICQWYIDAIKMEQRNASQAEWENFSDRLFDDFKIIPENSDYEVNIDTVVESRTDLSRTAKSFVEKIFSMSAVRSNINDVEKQIAFIENLQRLTSFDDEDAKMIGFAFVSLSFGLGLARAIYRENGHAT